MSKECKICKIEVQDQNQFEEHLQGKKHLNNVQHLEQLQSLAQRSIFISRFPHYISLQNLLHFFSQFGKIVYHRFGSSHVIIEYQTKDPVEYLLKYPIYFGGVRLNIQPRIVYDNKAVNRKDNKTAIPEAINDTEDLMYDNIKSIFEVESTFNHQVDAFIKRVAVSKTEIEAYYDYTCRKLNEILKTIFKDCKTYRFGSTVSGLGFKNCDLDIYVDIGIPISPENSDTLAPHAVSTATIFSEVKRMLYARSSLFTKIVPIPKAKTPIIKFTYIPTKISCDISFKNSLAVHNSQLVKFYLSLDERLKPTMMILKYWVSNFELRGGDKMSKYALTMLFIFYLQQPAVKLVPPIIALKRQCVPEFVEGWQINYNRNAIGYCANEVDAKPKSIPELLHGFFDFYANYKFKTNVICPIDGVSHHRTVFERPETFPESMDRYQVYLNSKENPTLLSTNKPMCLQDPNELNHNITGNLSLRYVENFQNYCAAASNICLNAAENNYKDLLPSIFSLIVKTKKCKHNVDIFIYADNLLKVGLPEDFETRTDIADKKQFMKNNWLELVLSMVKKYFEDILKFKIQLVKNEPDSKQQKIEDNSDVHSKDQNKIIWHCTGDGCLWIDRKKSSNLDPSLSLLEKEVQISNHLYDYLNSKNRLVKSKIDFTCNILKKENTPHILITLINDNTSSSLFAEFANYTKSKMPHVIKKTLMHMQQFKNANYMTTEEKNGTQEASEANGFNLNANDANNDDRGAQDLENQDNAIEDDCIIGLDATDVWEDDEKDKPRRRSWDRARGEKKRLSREREKERDRDNYRNRRRSRSRGRRSRSRGRRSRSNDRRREPSRRDPSKSNKDIEQDKLRAKKDSDSKILAEKEKAIKTLLDSDNVMPPGTETEAIQNIVEKNQQEQEIRNQEDRSRVSRDNKKRSPVHSRLGPKKLSKSPIRLSPLRRERRSPFSPGRRRRSIDRDNSVERRIASRRRLRERVISAARRSRSRSRDRRRSRSRSYERRRSRSGGRRSRSPFERRLRRRTLSRSRSPDRARRRSPFINELARQFSHDGMMPDKPMGPGTMPGYGAGPPMDPRMGPGILPTPGMPGPSMMNPMHPGVVHPAAPVMHPGPRGPPFLGYDGTSMPFESPMNMGPTSVDFPGPGPVDFPGPAMFSQGLINPVAPHPLRPVSPVPQPVPAPVIGQGYTAGLGASLQHQLANSGPGSRDRYSPNASYSSRHSGSPSDKMFRNKNKREERMKTPEPPIISDVKPNEKTSLSSLLEASVSNKDVSSATASFKGFRPEILRHCERALRSLPTEDPRLKMKGRFFFEPLKKDDKKDKAPPGSNSILLRKGRTEIYWDDEEEQTSSTGQPSSVHHIMRRITTHQKYCQTEETVRESVAVQAEETPKQTSDFSQQVVPHDLMPSQEETRRVAPAMIMEDNRRMPSLEDIRRPIDDSRRVVLEDSRRTIVEESRRPIDRLDWSMRETYDHGADRIRDKDDLRWNLNNSGGGGVGATGGNATRPGDRLPWSQGFSPKPIDHMHGNAPINTSMNDFTRKDNRDMDMRDRDMDIRMDMRVLKMLRERERLMGDARGTAGLTNRSGGLDEFSTRRQPPVNDEFNMRKNYGGGSSSGSGGGGGGGGPGSIGSFNRAMEMMEKERNEPQFGDSPIPDDPDDDLEIIEERGTWPTRTIAPTTNHLGNARGGGGGSNISRPFRGRLGGYRNY
ncbi:uncharacterized protein LOC131674929 [Phymastichus coffea]|uniref:uncharacterized protein LOC131674929 n=1 Tax=Phymastichus coffea TaxID=108790 RepID=UPI00273CBA0F|nr:uncharacterized protein LOC131674929 [Phymastichus coffea]